MLQEKKNVKKEKICNTDLITNWLSVAKLSLEIETMHFKNVLSTLYAVPDRCSKPSGVGK